MPSASPDFRIISIGTLAAHPLWNERGDVRTGHATTSLISAGKANIIVNPSLPPQAMLARMSERISIKSDEITHVFLTAFPGDHRRAIEAFPDAEWLISETERDAAGAELDRMLREARDVGERELVERVGREIRTLDQCRIAEDSIVSHVDLFPLPGVTAGTCGLLLALPGMTVLVCGDAIPTSEHLAQGKVLPGCVNIEQAQESFKEAVEIADVLVLGRDNLAMNPLRRM